MYKEKKKGMVKEMKEDGRNHHGFIHLSTIITPSHPKKQKH